MIFDEPYGRQSPDTRYPSVFYSRDRQHRVQCAAWAGEPDVTISTLLENKPGGAWVEVNLSPDEAEQFALHILAKVAVRRANLPIRQSPTEAEEL